MKTNTIRKRKRLKKSVDGNLPAAGIQLHRWRCRRKLPPAILIADNDVLLNGTEIITEITDKEVKIQLLSGRVGT